MPNSSSPPGNTHALNKQEKGLTHTSQETLLSQAFGITIGDIAEESPAAYGNTVVSDVEKLFADESVQGVVILDGNKPIGLLMKNKLYYQLGTHYGVSLYYRRSVERVMDNNPLIVNANLPLEAVAQLAMNRHNHNIYDLIIVVRDEQYIGTVSIIHLLKHLTNLQIRCAYNSNPLTGLPGNLLIEEQLKNIIAANQPFAVLYMDLDNFKAFNDYYGFEYGDQALLTTASILSSCLADLGSSKSFLGHIGGDDFVMITEWHHIEKMCSTIVSRFDHEVRTLYSLEDIKKGYITIQNRKGDFENFPLMTISIAVVTNQHHNFNNYLEIGEIAAELKKKAKSMKGSVWVVDKRKETSYI